MANIIDVAKKAGVSISTVSNVINGTKHVGDDLTERVKQAISELGYHSNEMASSMKRRVTKNIGVILPNISMIFFPEVLNGIETAAQENGYRIFYFSTNYDYEKEKEYLKLLKNSWVDGIILDSCCVTDQIEEYQKELISNVSNKYVPVVALETPFTANGISTITIDEVNYTKAAIEYLIRLGRKNIGLIIGPEKIPLCKNTMKGCKEALEKNGLCLQSSDIMHGDYFAESGYNAVKKALSDGAKWDAIFAENDQMAIGAIKAIKDFGLSIPEDIAIIGADGIFVSSLIDPPLTTIDLPKYSMGYKSVQLLIDMIRNPDSNGQKIQLNAAMTIRKSTDANSNGEWILTGW